MKLQDLLKLTEGGGASASAATNSMVSSTSGTTSGAVARYSPIVSEEPLNRLGDKKNKISFMKYATSEKECPGCKIIKSHGWGDIHMAPNKSKKLTCQLCGKSHSKGE